MVENKPQIGPSQASPVDSERTQEDMSGSTARVSDAELELLASLLRKQPSGVDFSMEPDCQRAIGAAEKIAERPSADASQPSRQEALSIQELGQYEILGKLGEGGMGAVYKARHRKLEKDVALKVLPADRLKDEAAVARFEREMRAVGKLAHANLVAAHDAGEVDGNHFLVMELVDGFDLSTVVRRCGPLPIAEACEVIRQTAQGLMHAAEFNMVHRDIKPGNLMVTQEGQVKILDMGLALLDEMRGPGTPELTTTGQMMGTIDYMAPEQGSNSHGVDARADIYAMGATLYKLLTGAPPFGGQRYDSPIAKMMALATETPRSVRELRDDVPENLAAIVATMLAKDPDDRPSTPQEVVELLAPFCAGARLGEVARVAKENAEKADAEPSSDTFAHLKSNFTDTRPSIVSPLKSAPLGGGSRVWGRYAFIGGGALLLLLAVVFFLPTEKGIIRVEVSDPNIEVALKGGDVILKGVAGENEIRVSPGEQTLIVMRGDFSFETDEFILKSGETVTAKVEMVDGQLQVVANGTKIGGQQVASAIPADGTPFSPGIAKPPTADKRPGDYLPPMSSRALVQQPAKLTGRDGEEALSWTIATTQPIQHNSGGLSTGFAALRDDGQRLAFFNDDGYVRVWDVKARTLLAVLVGHDAGPCVDGEHAAACIHAPALSWRENTTQLVSGSSDGTLRVWDVNTGQVLFTHGMGDANVSLVMFSPDGSVLAAGNTNGQLLFWDAQSWQPLKTLELPGVSVDGLVWSPDSQRVVVAGSKAIVWTPKTAKMEMLKDAPMTLSTPQASPLSWSPDGTQLVGIFRNQGLRILSADTWEVVRQVEPPKPELSEAYAFDWSPDGQRILASWTGEKHENQTFIHDLAGQSALPLPVASDYRSYLGYVKWLGDGRRVVVGLYLYDLESKETLAEVLPYYAASSDGSKILCKNHGWPGKWRIREAPDFGISFSVDFHWAGMVRTRSVWSTDGRKMHLRAGHMPIWQWNDGHFGRQLASRGHVLSWSPDDDKLAYIDKNGTSHIHSWKQGKDLFPVPKLANLHDGYTVWSPDGLGFAAVDKGGAGIVIDTQTGKTVTEWERQSGRSSGMAWAPHGKRVVIVQNNSLVFRSTEDGSVQAILRGAFQNPVWTADGAQLICQDGRSIVFLDVTKKEVVRRQTFAAPVRAMQRTNEQELIFATDDGKAYRWSYAEGEPVIIGEGLSGVVQFSPDGKFAAVERGTVRRLCRVDNPNRFLVFVYNYHWVCSNGHTIPNQNQDQLRKDLVYVVKTASGQKMFSPEDFALQFLWENEPVQVSLADQDE